MLRSAFAAHCTDDCRAPLKHTLQKALKTISAVLRLRAMKPCLSLSCLFSLTLSHEAALSHITALKLPGQQSRTQLSHLGVHACFFPARPATLRLQAISLSKVTCACFVLAQSSSSPCGFHRLCWLVLCSVFSQGWKFEALNICGSVLCDNADWATLSSEMGPRNKCFLFLFGQQKGSSSSDDWKSRYRITEEGVGPEDWTLCACSWLPSRIVPLCSLELQVSRASSYFWPAIKEPLCIHSRGEWSDDSPSFGWLSSQVKVSVRNHCLRVYGMFSIVAGSVSASTSSIWNWDKIHMKSFYICLTFLSINSMKIIKCRPKNHFTWDI